MAHRKVWFVTGAGRGMGTEIAKAALAADAEAAVRVAQLQQQIEAYRDLSTSLSLDELELAGSTR